MRTLLALLLLTLSIGTAKAEWPQNAFSCASYRQDLYWQTWARRHCPDWRWRQWRRWKAHHVPYASGDALCQPVVEATGDQAQSENAAWENALIAWKGRVRFRYGERFTDFAKARMPSRVCAPSSVADSGRDKAFSQLYRCEIGARPCRVEARPLNKEED